MSERRACRVIGADRKSMRYRSRRGRMMPTLRARLRELAAAAAPVRLSPAAYPAAAGGRARSTARRRPAALPRGEAGGAQARWPHVRSGTRAPLPVLALPNQRWSLDFVHDQFAAAGGSGCSTSSMT